MTTNIVNQKDKISVIMGIYNCAETLPIAIDSILCQTYPNWELIMCDDASIDNTYEVAKSYRDKYPEKIILIQNEQNSKLAYSLNHCLKYATGKFIARMDGDDISVPERFEKQIRYLQEHPDVDLVGTFMQYFDGNEFANVKATVAKPDKYILKNHVPFNHATIMTYKRVYDALGGYTVAERTNRAQDFDLWFRFFHAGFCGENIQEVLYYVRENLSAIKRRSFKVRWSTFETTRMGFKLLNFPKRWIILEFCKVAIKSLTPFWLVNLYRKFQKISNKTIK